MDWSGSLIPESVSNVYSWKDSFWKLWWKSGAVENEVVEESWTLESKLASAQGVSKTPSKETNEAFRQNWGLSKWNLRIFTEWINLKFIPFLIISNIHFTKVLLKAVQFCTATWMIWWIYSYECIVILVTKLYYYIISIIFTLMSGWDSEDWD